MTNTLYLSDLDQKLLAATAENTESYRGVLFLPQGLGASFTRPCNL